MAKSKLDESKLPFATITELSAALHGRELSSQDLVKFFGDRFEKIGPKYNAVALSLKHDAHKSAKEADSDIKRERFRSSLHGIPYGAKDLLAVAKYPTTWGAKPFADQIFDYDATVIVKLEDARAPLLGKLAMIELAGGGGYSSASASLQGPGLNPWNTSYWSGGSSSGSGIAVAAGLVPFALGSETSGSIITPACYCGVTGLRPTYGLVSRHGAMSLSWTLDKIGVLAHSAEDCGTVLHEIAGKDDDDPGSARKSFYYTPQYYGTEIPQVRVGFAPIDFTDWPDAALRPILGQALETIKSTGAKMIERRIPEFPYGAVIGTIIDSEAVSVFQSFIESGRVNQLADPEQIAGLKASMNYSALDYLKAMRVRSQIQQAFRDLFTEVDLLLAPAHFELPDRSDQPFDETPPKRPAEKGVGSGLVQASNLCGYPAVAFPCGFAGGLPVGLQVVGPAFTENRLLAFVREFQNRTGFHRQHPNVTA
jgi:aspartyl-tRNA(Asn)/glutamyl-tRNA(Gln) amidotransferase subunit A